MAMDFNELKAKIDEVNSQVQTLNNTRLQNLGKRETLEAQLNTLVGDYKNKYGVELKLDDLDNELAKLTAEKEAEFNKLEQGINLIKEGKYAEADELLNGKKTTDSTASAPEAVTNGDMVKQVMEQPIEEKKEEVPAPVAEPAPSPTTSVGYQEEKSEEPAEPVAPTSVEEKKEEAEAVGVKEEDVVAPPAAPVVEEPKEEVAAPPTAPSAPTETVAPPVAPPPVAPATETKAEEAPAAPPTVDNTIPGQTPLTPPTSNPSSFGAIFGGTSFSL